MSTAKLFSMVDRTSGTVSSSISELSPSQVNVEDQSVSSDLHSELGGGGLSGMIQAIYSSVLKDDPWNEVAKALSLYANCSCAVIVVRPPTSEDLGYLTCYPADPSIVRLYQENLWRQDPFLNLPIGEAVTIAEFVGTSNWLDSGFYQAILGADATCCYGLGVNLVSTNGTVCRIRLYRMVDEDDFTSQDKSRLTLLQPHFQQALTLANRLEVQMTQSELYESALNRLHIGTLVLDENQQMLRCNHVAQGILDENDGLRWSGKGLDTHYRNERQIFRELIESGSPQPQIMSVTRPSGKRKLGLVVRSIPLRGESEGKGRPAWICFLCDPDVQTKAPREVMRQVFEFTPSEANLAMEIANGLSIDEAAEVLNIRRNTARTHLRAIFAKAGVTRQAELVRLVLNGIIGLSAPISN